MQHRLKLATCLALLGLLFVILPGSRAFAQKTVLGELTKIGNGTLYLDIGRGNPLTLLIGPKTELWRRGNDLRDISQLVLGRISVPFIVRPQQTVRR